MAVPFSGDLKPRPRSVRIFSMQGLNVATTATGDGASGPGGYRESVIDWTTTTTATRVISTAVSVPTLILLSLLHISSVPVYSPVLRSVDLLQPFFFSSQTSGPRLPSAIMTRPKFRSPSLHDMS